MPPLNSEGNARVVVRVARNNHSPQFQQQSYEAEINRDAEDGQVVANVVAVDRDTAVSFSKCRHCQGDCRELQRGSSLSSGTLQ